MLGFFIILTTLAQSPVGKCKKISHVSSYRGETFDSHKALLTQRPCATKIVWEVNEDKTFLLNAFASGCDDSYKKIQEKLYSKTNWRMTGNKITISTIKNFASWRFTNNETVIEVSVGSQRLEYKVTGLSATELSMEVSNSTVTDRIRLIH